MGKHSRVGIFYLILILNFAAFNFVQAQCTSSDIMEPGFSFLTSSRGCAPFTVQIQTEYFASTVGTVYYVDWGDGTPEEQYVQTGSSGAILQHTYPNSPVECGYDVIIDASNICNPRGSVTPVETQVIVWTNDVININPQTFRVCQGFANELMFTDDSDWNCFPRDTRENDVSRWIQWIYGTGNAANRIPGIGIDNNFSGTFPINDPDANKNPIYPVLAPGEVSLPIQVPATGVGDIGKEFQVTLKNWNQCNPYDIDTKDGNGRNPVSGDVVNGDNDPVTTTANIIIVPSPEPDFQTRAGNATGAIKTSFCIDDQIYFKNLTPGITGANFEYFWEFYDNASGTGSPLNTSAGENPIFSYPEPGTKLIRLTVSDQNAAGNCETVVEHQVFISPLLQAEIGVTDFDNNTILPVFCQLFDESMLFDVRFHDESFGTITSDIRWRWEFYDENNTIIREEPAGGGFSASPLGPFDMEYQNEGEYLVKYIIQDIATGCYSTAEKSVVINLNPIADFTTTPSCAGEEITISDNSTSSLSISSWEYDIDNDNSIDTTFTSSTEWEYLFGSAGDYPVKVIVTNSSGCSDSIIKTVKVLPLPEASFSLDNPSGCSELEVNFTNESWEQSISVDTYEWWVDSGNGFELDSTQSPQNSSMNGFYSRIFANNSTSDKVYNIYLKAVGTNGCSTLSDTTSITVTPGASSGFLYTNYSPFNNNCSPQEVSFSADQATQELAPDNYIWTITTSTGTEHQENTGTTPNFSYVFSNSGNSVKEYDITLTTSLATNCSSDSTLRININPIPSAEFIIDTLSKECDRIEIAVSALQKGLSNYNWSMSAEGSPIYSLQGTEDSFIYSFDRINQDVEILISLNTRNLANCSSEPSSANFNVPQINDFSASFSVSSSELSLPDATVEIINNSTPGNWSYLWDFGDGATSTDSNVSNHSYSEAGEYLIQLLLSDGACDKTFSQLVSVTSPPPVAQFDYDPDAGCLPLTVSFINLSENASEYSWDFGDGNTSKLENPVYTYTTAGTYTVSLTAYENGEEDILTRENIIQVYNKPVAFFEIRPDLVYIPDQPVYTNNLSEGALTYLWDFGDGNTSEEFEPIHHYVQPGHFDVTLTAYNEYCADSMSLIEAVEAKEAGRVLIPNAFTPSRSGPGVIGSGENDVFLPLFANVSEFKLQIYNRWGELLFEGYNKGWDGYYNGQLCAQDVYVYKLEIIFNTGDKTTKVGDVNLIR